MYLWVYMNYPQWRAQEISICIRVCSNISLVSLTKLKTDFILFFYFSISVNQEKVFAIVLAFTSIQKTKQYHIEVSSQDLCLFYYCNSFF